MKAIFSPFQGCVHFDISKRKPPNDLQTRSCGATLSSGGNGNRSLAVTNGAPILRFAKKGSLKLYAPRRSNCGSLK